VSGRDHELPSSREDAESYCRDLLREADRDRYLASLFAPDATRPLIQAIYSFNVELARIRERTSDPRVSEIRLQWWLDAVEAIYRAATPGHPVLQGLARAIEHGGLPPDAFRNMIEARRFDLYDDPMPDLLTLEGYLGETSSAIIQLSALVLAGADARTAAEAAGYGGVAYGIAGALRSLPIHRSRGQCYIPADLLQRRELGPAHVISGRYDGAMQIVLAELRHRAATCLLEARIRHAAVPLPALPAFLPVSLTDLYLARLARRGFDPLARVAEVSQLRRQWRLAVQAFLERY
jgi:15-cis-phytoene synthase